MKPLADGINNILRSVYIKHGGKLFAEIMQHWPKIVGVNLSKQCWPIKISNQYSDKQPTTLNIGVNSSSVSLELNYNQLVIIEKITVYLGYKAIDRLVINIKNK